MAGRRKKVTYDQWLDSIFNHPQAEFLAFLDRAGKAYPDISYSTEIAYITTTFTEAEKRLGKYSNTQLGHGLWFLNTEAMHGLLEPQIDWSKRQRCVYAFYDLFSQIFARRCSSYLSYLDESQDNRLNGICYMWWDIFPFWGSLVDLSKIDDLFIAVMQSTLKLYSDACQESALHGLGHIPTHRDMVRKIIDNFLAENPEIRPELRQYALNAQRGMIL